MNTIILYASTPSSEPKKMEKRTTRVTETQWQKLLSYLEAHPCLVARGYNNTTSGREYSKRLWDNLAMMLNNEPGGTYKSSKDWAVYVSNFKCKMKKYRSDKLADGTVTDGDGSQARVLSDIEARFLSIMSLPITEAEAQEQGNDQSQSMGESTNRFSYEMEGNDPLMAVKQERSWTGRHEDSDTRESDLFYAAPVLSGNQPAEAMLPGSSDEGSVHDKSGTNNKKALKSDLRRRKREDELHRLKVAERVWVLKTLRERHATAQIERKRSHQERIWQLKTLRERHAAAQLERERAQLQRDLADLQLKRARQDAIVIDNDT